MVNFDELSGRTWPGKESGLPNPNLKQSYPIRDMVTAEQAFDKLNAVLDEWATWEYCFYVAQPDEKTGRELYRREDINSLGRLGWEACFPMGDGAVLMKRRIPAADSK